MKWLKSAAAVMSASWQLSAVALFAALFGGIQAAAVESGAWDTPAALLLLLLASGFVALKRIAEQPVKPAAASGWLLLCLAGGLMLWSAVYGSGVGRNGALAILCLGIVCYVGSWRAVRFFLLPLALGFMVLPFQEYWILACSYPLRLFSTAIAAGAFKLAGAGVSSHLTTIYVGGSEIAITDACSGIDQLGVLLFFAYILVLRLKLHWWWKVGYFLLLVPIVIAANSIRLIATIGLFYIIGDRAFESDWHVGLGYFFVVLSIGMLWLCREMLPVQAGSKEEINNEK